MAKKIMKPKKNRKFDRNNNSKDKIEKKPYSNEERLEKLRQDRLTIAKRYEEMRLYDEAILYYKKLGLTKDVERVMNTKRDIYQTKAQEFEKAGKYEDALRLYENLNLVEDVARLKKLVGDDDLGLGFEEPASPATPSNIVNTGNAQTGQEGVVGQKRLDGLGGQVEEDGLEQDEYLEVFEPSEPKSELPKKGPPKRLAVVDEPGDETDAEPVHEPEEPKQVGSIKPFKICPYCGEDLNLPKNPNFCPYCKEAFV
jgi:hypothetical protein